MKKEMKKIKVKFCIQKYIRDPKNIIDHGKFHQKIVKAYDLSEGDDTADSGTGEKSLDEQEEEEGAEKDN